ncbi:MAG TPA: GntR family transcriptional regulator [Devosia sp.]|nr:GntR family transcriptional regulator [Devosia sp.]
MSEISLSQHIANAINGGAYRPGEWLKQVDLAATFKVTRFEARKALEELTMRKVVTHIPERGYRVSEITEGDLRNAHEVRVILECAATEQVVAKIDDAGIKTLQELAAEFWRVTDEGSPQERNLVNHQFHDAMYAFAGNPLLSDLIREVRDRVRGAPVYLWPSMQSLRRSATDHDDIIKALALRDAALAMATVRRHILSKVTHPSGTDN